MSPLLLERRRLGLVCLIYLGFVVYGSLIPFELRPLTLDQALASFRHIAYLDLGAASRADWIANLVLYVPLAFFSCSAVLGLRRTRRLSAVILIGTLAFCVAIAVVVEFIQQFFCPRTVSLNDLLAETLGSACGIGLWRYGRHRIARLLDAFARGDRESVQAAATTYALFYLILALFPYDFVVSKDELLTRLVSPNLGWLLAPACGDGVLCAARLTGEVLAIAPLGLLLMLAVPTLCYRPLFLLGLSLGIGIETLQMLLISGTAQGISVLLRAVGLALGGLAGQTLRRQGMDAMAQRLHRAAPLLALPYLLTLAAVNGWFASPWLTFSEGLARMTRLRFLPFYYHYFTSEATAMTSLLANAAMYAPVGVALWAWRRSRRLPDRGGIWPASLGAALLALPLELGKLWLPGRHPDLTDLLIAATAAAFSYSLAAWLGRIPVGSIHPPSVVASLRTEPPPIQTMQASPAMTIVVPTASLIAAITGLWFSPVPRIWLLAWLAYALILWRYPMAWLFAIPALLPTLDLAAWHGQLCLDEFDSVVLVTLTVVPLRLAGFSPRPWPDPRLKVATALLWLSWTLATWYGLKHAGKVPLYSSYSPLLAWQVGKGLLWALLLVRLLRQIPVAWLSQARSYVCYGWLTALVIVVGVIWWERYLFVGLANFDSVFRVTATFASMHTGGAYLEAFLAFAFPFLVVQGLTRPNWLVQAATVGLGGMAGYAMLVTFARGGYAGMAVGWLTVVIGTLWKYAGKSRYWLTATSLGMIVLAAAVPIASEGFAHYRLARSGEDLAARLQHWRQALDLMEDSWLARLTGTGFGRYPIDYLLYADYREPPGGYVIHKEAGNHYLHLLPGESVYLDQTVAVEPFTPYQLSARIRLHRQGSSLFAPLCEKALLYSFRCLWLQLAPDAPSGVWDGVSVRLNSGELGTGGPWPHRPVKLSLANLGDHPIDIDDVSLQTADGRELIANGDFSQGARFWLFVADQGQAWHIDQAAVEVFFAQGWLGLLALALLLYAAVKALAAHWRQDLSWALAWSGGLVGFLTVSLLGSTMDAARSSMLLYLAAFCIVWLAPKGTRP